MNAIVANEISCGGALIRTRWLGRVEYVPIWQAMQTFTAERDASTADEIWLLEHNPVFTVGMNGSPAHVLTPGDIPVVHIDRGGQVTYHGPGQLVVYTLLELKRWRLGVRDLVVTLENAVIRMLATHGIEAHGKREAPGVYVGERKLASIGLRIKRGCSYHGLALNVAMDLEPFARINPCGFAGLEVVDLARLGVEMRVEEAGQVLVREFMKLLMDRTGDAHRT
jgi:lipoyl(octanoyl) transferase